jgi:endonuclease YncB( thermonuclease family)
MPSACRLEAIGAGRVAMVADGRSFVLDDGREFRLAGIEVPQLPAFAGKIGPHAGLNARSALELLIAGDAVEIYRAGEAATDRYGRVLVHARAGSGEWAAHELLAAGHARVSAHVGDTACAKELLTQERPARERKLGLWGEQDYGIRPAENGAELLAGRGQFTVAEGRLWSVRESGGTIYLNFGQRWQEALTVTIPKRQERTFQAAGIPLKQLENRRLRVRGWVEERNGPRIEALRPEQIEIAERN